MITEKMVNENIKTQLTNKDGKEFDTFIQILSTKCINEIIDTADYLTTQKLMRLNDLTTARMNGRYLIEDATNLYPYITKEEIINGLKMGYIDEVKCTIPVEYAGVPVGRIHLKISRPLIIDAETGERKPSKKTKDINTQLHVDYGAYEDLKGLTGVKKALKDFNKAENIKIYEYKLHF